MSSSTDKSHGGPAVSQGYETRDVNVRGVFGFLVLLSLVLVFAALLCWGIFKYLSKSQTDRARESPFTETRQLPAGPQLQANPRQDLLRFSAEQERSLESYSWENRAGGTVRVPIERAMELLLEKGLPVAAGTAANGNSDEAKKSQANGNAKR